MKPLRVALVHRDNPRAMEHRSVGWWAYPVPEFVWTHVPVSNGFVLDVRDLARKHDLVVWEDHRAYGTLTNRDALPIAYVIVDSTAGQAQFDMRYEYARQADLLLVDHDQPGRFSGLGKRARRLGYCVNDQFYRDYGEEKTVDVCFHFHPSPDGARTRLHEWLDGFCKQRGYVYAGGKRSGEEYPRGFNRAKVSVNLCQTPTNRPHRVFDSMACRTCLLTSKLPYVSGEEDVREGVHYADFTDTEDCGRRIVALLELGAWQGMADAAHELVMRRYTWTALAGRLRQTLLDEFPQLAKEGVTA